MNDKKNIVLAAGGTGGHIFPAEALAGELKKRGYSPVLITDKRYEDYSGTKKNIEYHIIKAGTLGRGIAGKVSGVMELGIGCMQAAKLLKKIKPLVVVGFGGYPSFPTMHAAVKKKYKTIIHEQNSMLGKANEMLAAKVDAIATSFDDVAGISDEDIDKVRLTGNPVRSSVKSLWNIDYPDLNDESTLKILITGGSQGASVFSSVIPDAIALLSTDSKKRIRIDQQCRKSELAETKLKYDDMGVSSDLASFFIDIPARLASSHLVIARSGASTIAELAVAGRPVIMVPYPHAKDDHQTVNANALEDVGGGWLMPEESFTASALASKIEGFMNLPSSLKDAAENAKKAGRPDADSLLADLVEELYFSAGGGDSEEEVKEISNEELLDKMESNV